MLLYHTYAWRNMYKDVQELISRCGQCDRARASFTGLNKILNPLPMRGLFYRWHTDLFGPLRPSPDGNTYCFVAIEAYSKALEVIPIKSKEAKCTAKAMSIIFGSKHASTQLEPYTLLHGVPPCIPPAIRERTVEPLTFDNPDAAAAELLDRQAAMQRDAAIAGSNILIAQHRDTLRYARIRDGQYLPKV